jgi:hypothetical protein
MATWQFNLRVIPRTDLERHIGTTPVRVGFEDLDNLNAAFPVSLEWISGRIGDLLPPTQSWSPDLVQFGAEEGTRADVWVDHDRIDSILVRIDARELNSAFLIRLADLGREGDFIFVSETGEVLPPNARRFFNALAKSNAARFVDDPEGFLATLPMDPD